MFFVCFLVKLDNLNRFLVKFHYKINITIYLTLLVLKLWQIRFLQKLPNCAHITILKFVTYVNSRRSVNSETSLNYEFPRAWHHSTNVHSMYGNDFRQTSNRMKEPDNDMQCFHYLSRSFNTLPPVNLAS